jgi:hypothetical protein
VTGGDRLDQAIQAAGPLLRRVDEVISTVGAPADHRLWAELRRVRVLPSDAVQAVAGLRPAELVEAAPELRANARAYAHLAESLPAAGGWSGEAAEAYDDARVRVADHVSGGPESLDVRLAATADLADALHEWMVQARGRMAALLAEILGSAEALEMSGETGLDLTAERAVGAAAEVGARVLREVAESYEKAADLLTDTAELADVLPLSTARRVGG